MRIFASVELFRPTQELLFQHLREEKEYEKPVMRIKRKIKTFLHIFPYVFIYFN